MIQQKEDEKILRMDHYVSGVDTNTDLRASGDFEDSGTMSDDEGYQDESEYESESESEQILNTPKDSAFEPRIHTAFYVPDNSEVHDDIHEITFNSYEESYDNEMQEQETVHLQDGAVDVQNATVTEKPAVKLQQKAEIYAGKVR